MINKNCDYMCKIYTEKVENSHHLIFVCVNVQHIFKLVGNILGFDVNWKHIVIGFYPAEFTNIRCNVEQKKARNIRRNCMQFETMHSEILRNSTLFRKY